MSQPISPDKVGVASVLLGVVALVTSWVVVGIGFGVAAVVTGFVARARVKRGEASTSGAATAGIVLGVVSIVVGLAAAGLLITR
jgi:hypothetical protein